MPSIRDIPDNELVNMAGTKELSQLSDDELMQIAGIQAPAPKRERTALGKVVDIATPVPALAAANVLEAGAGIADIAGYPERAKQWREDIGTVRRQVQTELPVEPDSWSEAGRGALTSIYGQVPAIAAGVLTGGATVPLTTLGTQAGLQKVSELTEGGMSKPTAIAGGVVSGIAEALTEKIPFETIFKKSGLSAGKKLVKLLISEQLGEQGATVVNTAIDKVTIRPDMTMDDYIRDVKATAKATLIQTGLMSPLTRLDTKETAPQQQIAAPAITQPIEPVAEPATEPIAETVAPIQPTGALAKAVDLLDKLGVRAEPLVPEIMKGLAPAPERKALGRAIPLEGERRSLVTPIPTIQDGVRIRPDERFFGGIGDFEPEPVAKVEPSKQPIAKPEVAKEEGITYKRIKDIDEIPSGEFVSNKDVLEKKTLSDKSELHIGDVIVSKDEMGRESEGYIERFRKSKTGEDLAEVQIVGGIKTWIPLGLIGEKGQEFEDKLQKEWKETYRGQGHFVSQGIWENTGKSYVYEGTEGYSLLTNTQWDELTSLGYTDKEIAQMSPAERQKTLKNKITTPPAKQKAAKEVMPRAEKTKAETEAEGVLKLTVEKGPSVTAAPATPYSSGAKVKVGRNPQPHTIINEAPFNPQTDQPGERYFNLRNDKTGEDTGLVGIEEIAPIKGRGEVAPKKEAVTPIKVEVFNFTEDVKAKHPDLMDEDISHIARETAAQFEQVAARSKGKDKGIAEDAVKAWNRFADTGELPIAKKGQFVGQPKIFGDDEFYRQVGIFRRAKEKTAKAPEEIEGIDLAVGDSFTVKGETHNVLSETEDGKLKIKNGTTQYVWPDETVEIDQGSLKKAEVKKEAPQTGKDQEMFAGVNKVPTAGLKTEKAQAEDLLGGFKSIKPVEDKQVGLFEKKAEAPKDVIEKVEQPGVIEDFGQKIEGARKDMVAAMRKEYSDDDIASLPLSKIWPADLSDKIEDPYIAAIAFAARAEIPSKPRQAHKVKRWVEKVKTLRSLAERMLANTETRAKVEAKLNEWKGLEGFKAKVSLLEAIDRTQWGRIGSVNEYPDAYKYGEGREKIPSPWVNVQIDGSTNSFAGSTSVADVIEKVNEKLGVEKQAAKMKFEVRGREGAFFINKAGDSEYRKLKTFETAKEALDYRNTNYNNLVAAWEDVKERDNVKQSDVRREENRPRTAEDYRKGKDITTEQFSETFGFRGGQFGKWVSQGSNAKERQWMINNAYDAFMDLATILNIPPKAISLNGELGIAFGARGSGAFAAHYEPDEIVINLTKTRGAGTLAHEWFHALDNYFQRIRGIKGIEREGRYVTYLPEALYVHKDQPAGQKLTKAELNRRVERDPNSKRYNMENWIPDPAHPQGVRPEVEARFSGLVNALDESPMAQRSAAIDKGIDGYWSRIIERAARAFENYIIAKMAEKGYNNDYLANVVNINEFKRDMGRYPYLKDEELAPVIEAFDNLFGEMQTKETGKGTALFSIAKDKGPGLEVEKVKSLIKAEMQGWTGATKVNIFAVEKLDDLPQEILNRMETETGELGAIKGVFDPETESVYVIASEVSSAKDVKKVIFHEAFGHLGFRRLMGKRIGPLLNTVWREKNAEAREIAIKYKLNVDAPGIEGYNARQRAAEEVVAHMAQEDVTPPLLKRIYAAIRNWLRAIKFDIQLTDDDLKKIVYDAAQYVRTGEKPLSLTVPKESAAGYPLYSRKNEATEGSRLASKIETDRARGSIATEDQLSLEGYTEQEQEAYRKLTGEDDNIDMAGHLITRDRKEIWEDAKKVADRTLGIVSTRLGNIHLKIFDIFRKHQYDLAGSIAKDHVATKPFIEKFQKLPKKIRIALSSALLDGRVDDADIIAKRHSILDEVNAVRKVFDSMRNRAIEAGLDVGKIDNYWARVVKNPKKLMAAIRGTEAWSGIDATIKRIEKEKGPLSEIEKGIIIDQVLRGYPPNTISLTSTSHLKERKFKQIPKEYLDYYLSADQSLLSYITSMNNTIEAAKFFGRSKKPRYDEFISGVRNQAREAANKEAMEAKNAAKSKATGEQTKAEQKAEEKRLRDVYWDAYNSFVSNAVKEAKIEADINPEIVTEAGLDESIGSLVNDLMRKGLLDPAKEQDLRDMTQAIFRPARTGYGVQAYKNLTYLQLLTQFTPAITQLQDIALSAEKAGYWNTLKVIKKVVTGKADVTVKDVNVENLMAEIDGGQDKLAKALQWALKNTGFTWMDRIGKETLLNASMLKFQKQAQANDPKLRARVERIFEEHNPEQVMKDLAAGVKNDDTLFMLFNELSDQQPITVLEVPEKYLTAKGVGKTFYALKTYQLKLFDVYRRDIWQEYRSGNKAEATRKLFYMTSALILMGMGTDEIKDFILGRDIEWDDRVIDNSLKLLGLSKYTIYKARKEGAGEALLAQFAPPLGIINPLAKDVDEFLSKGELQKGARSTANVPIVGKAYYWWFGRGAEQKAEESEKKGKEERIRTRLGEASYKRYREQADRKALITRLKSERTKALNRADTSEEKRNVMAKYRDKFIEARGE